MGTYSKIILSGSTDGEGIKVTGSTPSKGSVVHTAVTGAAQSLDEVWLYGFNAATTPREISISFGVTTATASQYTYLLPTTVPDGLHLLSPGLVIRNSKKVRAFATADSGVHVFGYVNRFAS